MEMDRRQTHHRADDLLEAPSLTLLHCAIRQDDYEACSEFERHFGETMHGWLYQHPLWKTACQYGSEEYYVTLAFERFWQVTVQQQVDFKTFAGVVTYLRASLNGAVLDTLRAYTQPREVPKLSPGALGEASFAETGSGTLWEILHRMLPSERERRLAYLLYRCNLTPREIVRYCPQEWPDVQEISRLRRTILQRILRNADLLRWQFNPQEQS